MADEEVKYNTDPMGEFTAEDAKLFEAQQGLEQARVDAGVMPAPQRRSALGLGIDIGTDRLAQTVDSLGALNPFASSRSQRINELQVSQASRDMAEKIELSGVNTEFLEAEGLGDFVDATLFNLGSMAPDLAVTLAGMATGGAGLAAAGAARGASIANLGRQAISSIATREAAKLTARNIPEETAQRMAAQIAKDKFRRAVINSGGAAPTAGMMIGEAATSQIDQLGQIDSPLGALATGTAAAFMEYIPIARRVTEVMRPDMSSALFQRMGSVMQDAELANPGFLRRVSTGSLKGAGEEAMAEVMQTAIIDSYVDFLDENAEFFTPETLKELAEAALGGGVLGGVMGGAGGVRKRQPIEPVTGRHLGSVKEVESTIEALGEMVENGDVNGTTALLARVNEDIEDLSEHYVQLSSAGDKIDFGATDGVGMHLQALGTLRNELEASKAATAENRKRIDAQKAQREGEVEQAMGWVPLGTVVDQEGEILDKPTPGLRDVRDFGELRGIDNRVFPDEATARAEAKRLDVPVGAYELFPQEDGGVALALSNKARRTLDEGERAEGRRRAGLEASYPTAEEAEGAAARWGVEDFSLARDADGYRLVEPVPPVTPDIDVGLTPRVEVDVDTGEPPGPVDVDVGETPPPTGPVPVDIDVGPDVGVDVFPPGIAGPEPQDVPGPVQPDIDVGETPPPGLVGPPSGAGVDTLAEGMGIRVNNDPVVAAENAVKRSQEARDAARESGDEAAIKEAEAQLKMDEELLLDAKRRARDAKGAEKLRKLKRAAKEEDTKAKIDVVAEELPDVPRHLVEAEVRELEKKLGYGIEQNEMRGFSDAVLATKVNWVNKIPNGASLRHRAQTIYEAMFAQAEIERRRLAKMTGNLPDPRPHEIWYDRARLSYDAMARSTAKIKSVGGIVRASSMQGQLLEKGHYDVVGLDASTPAKLAQILERFRYEPYETSKTIAVDEAGNIIAMDIVSQGHPNSVARKVPTEGVLDMLMDDRIHKIYTAHNHPSSRTAPSEGDYHTADALAGMFGDKWAGEIITDTTDHTFFNPVEGKFESIKTDTTKLPENLIPDSTWGQNPNDNIALASIDHGGQIIGYVEVPIDKIEDGTINLNDIIETQALRAQTTVLVDYTHGNLQIPEQIKALIHAGKVQWNSTAVASNQLHAARIWKGDKHNIKWGDLPDHGLTPVKSWKHALQATDKSVRGPSVKVKNGKVLVGNVPVFNVPDGTRVSDGLRAVYGAIYHHYEKPDTSGDVPRTPKTWQGAWAMMSLDTGGRMDGYQLVEGLWRQWKKLGDLDPLTMAAWEEAQHIETHKMYAVGQPATALKESAYNAGVELLDADLPKSHVDLTNEARAIHAKKNEFVLTNSSVAAKSDEGDVEAIDDLDKQARSIKAPTVAVSKFREQLTGKARLKAAAKAFKEWAKGDSRLTKAMIFATSPFQVERRYREELPRLSQQQDVLTEFTSIAESPNVRLAAEAVMKDYRAMTAEEQKAMSRVAHYSTLVEYDPSTKESAQVLPKMSLEEATALQNEKQAELESLEQKAAVLRPQLEGPDSAAIGEALAKIERQVGAVTKKRDGARAVVERWGRLEEMIDAQIEVQKMYDELSEPAKESYKAMLQMYRDRNAERLRQMDLLLEQLRDEGHSEAKLLHLIETREKMEKERVYFPLRRKGKYWLNVRVGGEVIDNAAFDSRAERDEAVARARKLHGESAEIGYGTQMTHEDGKDLNIPDFAFVDGVRKLITDANEIKSSNANTDNPTISPEAADMLSDAVYQMYLKYLPQLSPKKSDIHRQGIAGYDDDAGAVFTSEMDRVARMNARAEHAPTLRRIGEELQQDAAVLTNESMRRRQREEQDFWDTYSAEDLMRITSAGDLDKLLGDIGTEQMRSTIVRFHEQVNRGGLRDEKAMLNAAGRLSRLIAERRETLDIRQDTIDEFDRQVAEGEREASTQQDLLAHIADDQREAMKFAVNPDTDKWAVQANQFGFHWFLGFNISTAALNVAQTFTVAASFIGGRHGFVKAERELAKAVKEFARGGDAVMETMSSEDIQRLYPDIDPDVATRGALHESDLLGIQIRKNLRDDDERMAYMEFARTQTIARTMSDDAMGSRETPTLGTDPGGSVGSRVARKVMDASVWAFSATERINREATAMTAYRLEKAKLIEEGMAPREAHDAAVVYAKTMTKETHLDYGNSNRAKLVRGSARRVAFQFQTYPLGMFRIYMDGVRKAYRKLGENATPEQLQQQAEDRRTFHQLVGTQLAVGGLAGAPAIYLVGAMMNTLVNALFLEDDEEMDTEARMAQISRAAARVATFGVGGAVEQKAFETLHYGALTATIGADIGSRLSLSSLFLRGSIGTRTYEETLTEQVMALTGPAGGILVNTARALDRAGEGQHRKALESFLPVAGGNVSRALRYFGGADVNKYGETIVETSWIDAGLQGIGFAPIQRRLQLIENSAIRAKADRIRDVRTGLMRYYHAMRTDPDATAEDYQDWAETVVEFNKRNPTAAITRESVNRSIKARARRAENQQHGLHLTGSEEHQAWLFSSFNFNE